MTRNSVRLLFLCLLLALAAVAGGCGGSDTPPAGDTPEAAPSLVARRNTPIATWTPEPVTPTATATATATPTPIVYAIQSGDTLLEVAKRFGVSAAEIQEVNGITDPRLLQIGQEIIIPAGSAEGVAHATPTPTPMPVHIAGVSYSRSRSGDVVVLGEIVNDGVTGVEEVIVLVELLDADGGVSAAGEAAALMDVIKVGSRAPFGLVLPQAPAPAQVRTRVLRAMPEVPERAMHRDLRLSELSGRAVYDLTFAVLGKVRNHGDVPAQDIFVVITLYGPDGAVVGAKREALPQALTPGNRAVFQATIVPIGWPVERFEVLVEGRTAPPELEEEPTSES